MVSLFIFTLLAFLGLVFLLMFSLEFSLFEFISLGVVIGALFYTWSIFLLALFLPLSLAILLINIVLVLFFALFFFKRSEAKKRLQKKIVSAEIGHNENIFLILEGIFFLIFLWLFPKIILAPSEQGWHVGLNTFGDTQFHVAAITSFAYGENIPPQHPFFAGIFFAYPFMADFFSSILIRVGESLRLAMLVPTIILSLVSVHLLFSLTKRITESTLAAIFAPILFFFNGGIGFWYFLQNNKGKSLLKAFLNLSKDYTHIFEENMHFTNTISGFFPTERSLLFGLPIFLIVLLFLFHERKRQSVTPAILLSGALFGLLPLTHTHAFLILGAVIGWYAMLDVFISKGRRSKKWLGFFLVGGFLALPQLLAIFPQVSEAQGSFIRFYWGWMKKPEEQWLLYWFKTVGPIFLLVPLALVDKGVPRLIKFLFVPFLFVFFAANLYFFQPYDWDNVKFFLFVLLGSSILVADLLSRWWRKGKVGIAFVSLILVVNSLSGILSIKSEPQPHNLLYSTKNLQAAEFIKKSIEPEATFLTGPEHNSPASLAGRKILMSYQGYLWVHGIPYQAREKDILAMFRPFSKETFFSLATKHNVSYVIIGPTERREVDLDVNFFQKNLIKIFDNNLYKIYKI